jgi:hypothetical protein
MLGSRPEKSGAGSVDLSAGSFFHFEIPNSGAARPRSIGILLNEEESPRSFQIRCLGMVLAGESACGLARCCSSPRGNKKSPLTIPRGLRAFRPFGTPTFNGLGKGYDGEAEVSTSRPRKGGAPAARSRSQSSSYPSGHGPVEPIWVKKCPASSQRRGCFRSAVHDLTGRDENRSAL